MVVVPSQVGTGVGVGFGVGFGVVFGTETVVVVCVACSVSAVVWCFSSLVELLEQP